MFFLLFFIAWAFFVIAMMLAVTDIAVAIAATILYVTCLICFISNGAELSFIRHGFG